MYSFQFNYLHVRVCVPIKISFFHFVIWSGNEDRTWRSKMAVHRALYMCVCVCVCAVLTLLHLEKHFITEEECRRVGEAGAGGHGLTS